MATPISLLRGVMFATIVSIALMQPVAVFGRPVAERVYADTPFLLTDSSSRMLLPPDADTYLIDVRGAMAGIGERVGMAPNYWGMNVIFPNDTIGLMLRHGNTSFGDILDKRQSILTLTIGGEVVWSEDIGAFDNASGCYNTLQLSVDRGQRRLELRGGGKKMTDIFLTDLDMTEAPECVSLWSKGPLTVASYSVETTFSPSGSLATGWDSKTLEEYLKASADPLEGYWQYLDRENNPQYARLGGRYLLAVVRNESADAYDIIYVGGAETYASEWQSMMRKGRLRPTIFLDHYDLEWIDSTFEPITRDVHAQMTDGAILSLSFPLLKTTVRFSKMRLK